MRAGQVPPLRVGLIGVSGYGRTYLRMAREFQGQGTLTLVAVTIINPIEEDAVVRELTAAGTRIYLNYEEMLTRERAGLDACLIPTGIPWHARMAIAALEAGLHVMVEKPLAGSLADVAAIRAAEQAAGRVVAVGFQDLYSEEAQQLKADLLGGLVGTVQAVKILGVWPRAEAYFQRNAWAGRLAAGGVAVLDSPLQNGMSHFAHLGLFFASPRMDDSAVMEHVEAELWRAHAIESFDTAVVRARSPEGVRFWFGVSHAAVESHPVRVRVEGSAGAVEWRHEERRIVIDCEGRQETRALSALDVSRDVMFASFVKRVQTGRGFVVDSAMAARHVALVEAVAGAAPIREVDASLISRAAGAKGTFVAIRGIIAALQAAEAAESSLAAVGFVGDAAV